MCHEFLLLPAIRRDSVFWVAMEPICIWLFNFLLLCRLPTSLQTARGKKSLVKSTQNAAVVDIWSALWKLKLERLSQSAGLQLLQSFAVFTQTLILACLCLSLTHVTFPFVFIHVCFRTPSSPLTIFSCICWFITPPLLSGTPVSVPLCVWALQMGLFSLQFRVVATSARQQALVYWTS